jgi:hypothetical protein
MDKYRNMKITRVSFHKKEHTSEQVPPENTQESISFGEFVDRMNGHSIDYPQEQIRSNGTFTGIIGLISFGIFEKMIG